MNEVKRMWELLKLFKLELFVTYNQHGKNPFYIFQSLLIEVVRRILKYPL